MRKPEKNLINESLKSDFKNFKDIIPMCDNPTLKIRDEGKFISLDINMDTFVYYDEDELNNDVNILESELGVEIVRE